MPQRLLFDIADVDPERPEFTLNDIRKINPHRFEFEQLTAVLRLAPEEKTIVGLRDIRSDEFWVRGHIPGRPLFPGVLMLESAAQLCAFYCGKVMPSEGFLGFAGIDEVRYRGPVTPGQRLLILGLEKTLTPSRCLFATQGVVGGRVVFEATILGLRIK